MTTLKNVCVVFCYITIMLDNKVQSLAYVSQIVWQNFLILKSFMVQNKWFQIFLKEPRHLPNFPYQLFWQKFMILKIFHDSKCFKTEVFALIFLTFLESFFGQPINNK